MGRGRHQQEIAHRLGRTLQGETVMMNGSDFEALVMSKLEKGAFKPILTYNKDDDALEIVVSSETYRIQAVEGDRSASVYVGRESGEVVGVRLIGISKVSAPPAEVLFQVHNIENGQVTVRRVFKVLKALREKA